MLMLAVFAIGPVVKSTEAACGGNGVSTTFWTGNGSGSSKTACWGTNYSNFSNVFLDVQNFECGAIHGDDWQDCISSVRLTEPVDSRVCYYINSNYGGGGVLIESTWQYSNNIWSAAGTQYNNAFTSMKWC